MCEAEKLSQGPRWEKLIQDLFKEQRNLGYSHTQAAFSRCIFCMLPLPGPKSSVGLLSVCRVGYGGALCTAGEEGLSLPCSAHLTLQSPLEMQHLTLQYQAAQAPDASTLARLPGQGTWSPF